MLSGQFTIVLHDCRFFSHHGLFDAERVAGNEFLVTAKVKYTPQGPGEVTIDTTVSYAALYDLIADCMAHPQDLLETVAADMAARIVSRWPMVTEISIGITKITPPIAGFTGKAEVIFDWKL